LRKNELRDLIKLSCEKVYTISSAFTIIKEFTLLFYLLNCKDMNESRLCCAIARQCVKRVIIKETNESLNKFHSSSFIA